MLIKDTSSGKGNIFIVIVITVKAHAHYLQAGEEGVLKV